MIGLIPLLSLAPYCFAVNVVGSGRPILMIPGLSCGGDVWDDTVKVLKAKHECHILTLPGFAGQKTITSPYLETVRNDIVRYIREKHLVSPVVMGHSLGGSLSLWLAATEPKTFSGCVSVDGVPWLALMFNPKATLDQAVKQGDAMKASFAKMTQDQWKVAAKANIQSQMMVKSNADRVAKTSGLSDPGTVGAAAVDLLTHDFRPLTKNIAVSVLLFMPTGYVDEAGTAAVEASYRAQFPGFTKLKLVSMRKSLHFLMFDEPEKFQSELIKYLSEVN